jgi:hypothetical protein
LIKGNPVWASVGIPYFIFAIIGLIALFFILWVIFLFLIDFIVPYMYDKNVGTKFAWKVVWKQILKNKKEVFVYWLSRFVLGLAISILYLIISIIVLLALVLVGGILFGIGFLLFKLVGVLMLWVTLGIILGLILFLILIIIIAMITLPLGIFGRYFSILNFEELMGIKLLKSAE